MTTAGLARRKPEPDARPESAKTTPERREHDDHAEHVHPGQPEGAPAAGRLARAEDPDGDRDHRVDARRERREEAGREDAEVGDGEPLARSSSNSDGAAHASAGTRRSAARTNELNEVAGRVRRFMWRNPASIVESSRMDLPELRARNRPRRRRDPAAAQRASAARGASRGAQGTHAGPVLRALARAADRRAAGRRATPGRSRPRRSARCSRRSSAPACRSRRRVRVAYLGPEATFTHMAVKRQFGLSARSIPMGTIAGVFDEVERGNADYGVVPVENSTEGVVNHTLDTFLDQRPQDLRRDRARGDHCLLAAPAVELGADRAGLLAPAGRWRSAALAVGEPAARDAGRGALDRRGGAPGPRRRARRRRRLGAGGQALRPGGARRKHRGRGAQHDALPRPRPRQAEPTGGQDLAPARDRRRAGDPLPRARALRRARRST